MAFRDSEGPYDVAHLLGIPWVEGDREFCRTGGTDCLGITLHFVRAELGIPVCDPWEQLRERWRELGIAGLRRELPEATVADFLGPGWVEARHPLELGDIVETHGGTHVAASLGGGWLLSARKGVGTYQFRADSRVIGSVWRHTC